jgi:hypothetical protein
MRRRDKPLGPNALIPNRCGQRPSRNGSIERLASQR